MLRRTMERKLKHLPNLNLMDNSISNPKLAESKYLEVFKKMGEEDIKKNHEIKIREKRRDY